MISFSFHFPNFCFFLYIRGSVHYSQNDVPCLLPWYIRRFTYHSAIDPLVAIELNNRISLLYLRKHLGTFLYACEFHELTHSITRDIKQAIQRTKSFRNWWKSTSIWSTKELPSQTLTESCHQNLRKRLIYYSQKMQMIFLFLENNGKQLRQSYPPLFLAPLLVR